MMKFLRLIALFLTASNSFAQDSISEKNSIATAEMKSGASLMNLVVNPNTQNYDVTYHK